MSGIAFIYNLCGVDVFVSINGSSPQPIAAVESHPSNATEPHRLHFAAVPQTRNHMPFGSWEFGIDTEPVANSIEFRLGSVNAQPIEMEIDMSLLKHPNQSGPVQIPLESDSRLYLHTAGLTICAGGKTTQVLPTSVHRDEEGVG